MKRFDFWSTLTNVVCVLTCLACVVICNDMKTDYTVWEFQLKVTAGFYGRDLSVGGS